MTDEPPGRRLDPFNPHPGEWARVRADEIVRQIFAFEPGSGGWGPAGGWGRRRATTPPVLRFSDRHIVGVLDLRAVEFPHLLEFVRCRFEEPPDLVLHRGSRHIDVYFLARGELVHHAREDAGHRPELARP